MSLDLDLAECFLLSYKPEITLTMWFNMIFKLLWKWMVLNSYLVVQRLEFWWRVAGLMLWSDQWGELMWTHPHRGSKSFLAGWIKLTFSPSCTQTATYRKGHWQIRQSKAIWSRPRYELTQSFYSILLFHSAVEIHENIETWKDFLLTEQKHFLWERQQRWKGER